MMSAAGKGVVFRMFVRSTVGLVCLAAAGAFLTAGRTQEKPLQYESFVTVKLLQVYVTGKKDAPVTDLAAADFEIFDNGTSYPVSHFEKHFVETEKALPAAAAGAAAPASSLGRKFFLIFDFALTDARGLVKAKKIALDFLASDVQPGDQIGMISYSPSGGLVLHEYLTTDHDRIRAIVAGLDARPMVGQAQYFSQFLFSTTGMNAGMSKEGGDLSADSDSQFSGGQADTQKGRLQGRQNYADQARDSLNALGQLAKTLRYIPGFKNIILFSGGIARRVLSGEEIAGASSYGDAESQSRIVNGLNNSGLARGDSNLRVVYENTLKEFEAANCPVYAVDVSRSVAAGDVGAFGGISQGALRGYEGADSLRVFAGKTGGSFFADTMEAGRIVEDIQKTTSGYYVLGYSINETWDASFHRIKVKVKRRGVDVRTQGGYFNPKPFSEYSPYEKLMFVVDLALSDLPQTQTPAEFSVVAMPLRVKSSPHVLAFARLTRMAQADFLGKNVEAYLLLTNDKGEMTSIKDFRLDIPEKGRETMFPAFILPVNAGPYFCRVVVIDMNTGRGARGASSVFVPARPNAALSLDPPLLLVPEKDAMDLSPSSGESLSGFYGYDPKQYAPFVGDVPAGRAGIQAALRVSAGGSAGIEIKGSLLAPGAAAPVAVPVSIVERSADAETWFYLADISTGELSPGRFTLKFEARDPQTGTTAASSAVFTVK